MDGRHFRLHPVSTPLPDSDGAPGEAPGDGEERDAFRRPEAEDDDGYDPYSDRPAEGDPQWEEDPWD